jgi:hypothetical protein
LNHQQFCPTIPPQTFYFISFISFRSTKNSRMSNKCDLARTVLGDNQDTCFILLSWLDSGGLRVDAMAGTRAWSGRISCQNVDRLIRAWDKSSSSLPTIALDDPVPSDYRKQFHQLTSEAFLRGEEMVRAKVNEANSAELVISWKIVCHNRAVRSAAKSSSSVDTKSSKPYKASLSIQTFSSSEAMSHMMSVLFDDNATHQSRVAQLENTRSGLERSCAEARAQCQQALREREDKESEMFLRFHALLTTKKERVQQLHINLFTTRQQIEQDALLIQRLEEERGVDDVGMDGEGLDSSEAGDGANDEDDDMGSVSTVGLQAEEEEAEEEEERETKISSTSTRQNHEPISVPLTEPSRAQTNSSSSSSSNRNPGPISKSSPTTPQQMPVTRANSQISDTSTHSSPPAMSSSTKPTHKRSSGGTGGGRNSGPALDQALAFDSFDGLPAARPPKRRKRE